MELPKFLYTKALHHNTSLGNNEALPPEEDYVFEYKMLKKRFSVVSERIEKLNLESLDTNYLINYINKLLVKCVELEKPLRSQLEKICKDCVIKLLNVPEDIVVLECKLVDVVKPKEVVRILPDESDNRTFEFEDLEDFGNASKVILKRRMINALIQGVAYKTAIECEDYITEIYKIDSQLLDLYKQIIIINDYLLFIKEEKIDEKNINYAAYVATYLGGNNEKTIIDSQGVIFPYLLIETLRGFFELFASHGLPKDRHKANYVLSQADFFLAEIWDIRMGIPLWEVINNNINDTKILPFIFSNLCELKVNNFNRILKEIFAQTKKGKKYLERLKRISKTQFEELNINVNNDDSDDSSLITDNIN